MQLGKRIAIIGTTSSVGKSTLSYNLSKKLNLPVIHLDQLYFYPVGNWIPRPKEEFMELHSKAIGQEKWIIDGKYSSHMPNRFDRADTIIFIRMNRLGALYRYTRRHFSKTDPQIGRIETPQEKFSWNMVVWILDFRRFSKEVRLERKEDKKLLEKHKHKLIVLRSFKEINEFLAGI